MTMPGVKRNAARDAEIRRMAARGCPQADIAKEFRISEGRVWQIVHGHDESKVERRKGASAEPAQEVRLSELPAELMAELSLAGQREIAAQHHARPRLRKEPASGLWECSDGVVSRAARTFQGAYQRWLTAAIAEKQRRVAPAAWPTEADVKSVRRAPNGRGQSIDAVKPPPAQKVDLREPMAPYNGPVTVLPGTREFAPLKLSTALQRNGARAAAVQPRMISIAGSPARGDAA